ncbi:GSU2403 family nucleotidyltransferase fold protein [Pseudoroseomonas wenyumeiae]
MLLFGAGILVNVPSPARFVWHKLILSQVRTSDRQKARKDILQAQTLLPVLAEDRPYELRSAWRELATDGRVTWQETAKAGIAAMDPQVANFARDLIQSA